MEYPSDFLLVHRARNGDEDACEKLVKKYYPSIYQYCLLHTSNLYDAQDLTQEVFTSFFINLHRYRECGKVKNYLYTVAGNALKNYYKKKRDIPVEQIAETVQSGTGNVESIGEYAGNNGKVNAMGTTARNGNIQKDLGESVGIRLDIERAVRKLPEEIREVAILFFFQELKQREIAELLHIKLSLVKYRIGRARELLIQELEVEKHEKI